MKVHVIFSEESSWAYNLDARLEARGFVDYEEIDGGYRYKFEYDWNYPFKPSVGERVAFLDIVLQISAVQYNLNRNYIVLFCK